MLNDLEIKVTKLMLQEYSSNVIAKTMGMSIVQINTIRKGIYDKMDVHSPIGLIKKCIQLKIIKPEELLDN
ncbi:MAG: hypothetical protein R2728_01885 [Chitinophagales bacterium]